ncbi:MAG: Gfo/Idh/MocA family oxidoreductase [Kiritimatiellia bacterium]
MRIPSVTLVGVTGYGGLYLKYLTKLHIAQRLRLRYAVVVNPEEATSALDTLAEHGTEVFSSLEELTASRSATDWVCLPVGIPHHLPLTEQSLNWGAQVLLEKPAAGDVRDWRALCAAEAATGKKVRIGFQHIHAPEIQEMKHALVRGEHGKVLSMSVEGYWPRGDAYYQRNSWAGKIRANHRAVNDSPIQNAFAHFLNLGLYLAGNEFDAWAIPDSVEGTLWRVRPDIETFDACRLRFTLPGEVPFDVTFSHACTKQKHPVLHLQTEKGVLEWRQEREPHMNMFEDILLRDAFSCSLTNAGAHIQAVELTRETLTVQSPASAQKSKDGFWFAENIP